MGHKKVGVPSRRYTNEFKVEAVRLAQSVGCSEASRRLGIPESSLFNWVKLERACGCQQIVSYWQPIVS
jgi:transposase